MSELIIDEPKKRNGQPQRSPGRFSVLDRDLWDQLNSIPTTNRLNLITAFLVLLAGTGGDNRTTKWSTRACEERAGLGKPRAKTAINELMNARILEHTDSSTAMRPQYRLPPTDRHKDSIFLPVELVTGCRGEVSVLRRVRETGDALLLRMLIDMYGLIEIDAPFGVPLQKLKMLDSEDADSKKVLEMGAHAVWAGQLGTSLSARGDWVLPHKVTTQGDCWATFWDRVRLLQRMGVIWFEPWVFDSPSDDAEPLFPINLDALYRGDEGPVVELTRAAMGAAGALASDRSYLLENFYGNMLIPLPAHHKPPSVRGVARLRVEADTPGRRRAYALRMKRIESATAAYRQLEQDAAGGIFSRPLQIYQVEGDK